MNNDLISIRKNLRNSLAQLRRDYSVRRLGIFGSVARGNQTVSSDVDILVDFTHPLGLFRFVELENHLSQLLGKPVDLVTKNALKPIVKDQILQETIYA